MIVATIITPWLIDDVVQPQLLVDHPLPSDSRCVDITSQLAVPPAPNLYLVQVEIEDNTSDYIDTVEQDERYAVITSETSEPAV